MRNKLAVYIGLLSIVLVIAACSSDSSVDNQDQTPKLLSITPEDGSSDVPVSSSISMIFSTPMDTLSVRLGIHLSGGEMMREWMDSLDHYGGMGHMGNNRMEHMMNWMDSIGWRGQIHWNQKYDSCEFIPDSIMHPNTVYMIVINEEGMMGHRGHGMHMDHGDNGYHYYHFQTADK